jgi:hypothetical protein
MRPTVGVTLVALVGFVALSITASGTAAPATFNAERSTASTEFTAEAFTPGRKFVSERYGYEVVLPAGRYYAYYATRAWNGKEFPFGDTGKVDVFLENSDRKFIAAATRLPTGTTLRKWEASYIAVMQSICKKAQALRNTTLSGVAAREFTIRCPMYDVIAVVALHHGRGYVFQFVSPSANTKASDRRIFDAGRRTFRFTSN